MDPGSGLGEGLTGGLFLRSLQDDLFDGSSCTDTALCHLLPVPHSSLCFPDAVTLWKYQPAAVLMGNGSNQEVLCIICMAHNKGITSWSQQCNAPGRLSIQMICSAKYIGTRMKQNFEIKCFQKAGHRGPCKTEL